MRTTALLPTSTARRARNTCLARRAPVLGLLVVALVLGTACEGDIEVFGRSSVSPTPRATQTVERTATPRSSVTAVPKASATPGETPRALETPRTGTSPLSEAARAKLDPLLIRAYEVALTQPLDSAAVATLERLVAVRVTPAGLEVRVLVRTTASDAELAGAGLEVTSRIGDIVSGAIVATALPRLTALPSVTSIEGARLTQP